MDTNLALRLSPKLKDGEKDGKVKWVDNSLFDSEFSGKVNATAKAYIEKGLTALNYHLTDLDCATDLVEMLAPVAGQAQFNALDRNSPLTMRHPLTFTEMFILTTNVAQILFGGETARKVEAQGPDDGFKADDVNALLSWNDAKIGIYMTGWLWTWAAIVYNRGVWFESTDADVIVEREEVLEPDLSKPKIPVLNKNGSPKVRNGEVVMDYQSKVRYKPKRTKTGFFNSVHLVSPYDFIADPGFPLIDYQKGRFAGHRVMISWLELKQRSELDPEDEKFVLPHVVEKIKHNQSNKLLPAALGSTQGPNSTRTYYERQFRGNITAGIGAGGAPTVSGTDAIDKDDGGIVECFNLTIRAQPKSLKMYEDEDFELINLLVTAYGEVLSCNVQPNKHDEFPYGVAEGKPNAHRQFSPGWALANKPVQDRVDNLNNTHAIAQARMGNILIVDSTKCDVSNLFAPDKNGLMIFRNELGNGAPVEDIVHQIPLKDVTASYNDEMAMWEATAEKTTGASPMQQGITEDPSQTATQFDGVRQMSVGRMSDLARKLSQQGLMPQTKRFVMNFQQFGSEKMVIRITGKDQDFDPMNPPQPFREIQLADIQGGFDVIPDDGALPGADTKVVAAATRALEVANTSEMLAPAFSNQTPGAIDVIKMFVDVLKKSGLPVSKYQVTLEEAQKNAMAALQAQGLGVQMQQPGAVPQQPAAAQNQPLQPPTDASGLTSAAEIPAMPSAQPPEIRPSNV